MSKLNKKVVECYSCGLFVKKQRPKKGYLKCPRCNSKIVIEKNHSFDSLYYAISSLLLFVILNIYPLISLSINGKELQTNLIGVVWILFNQGFFFVSLIVLFTIVLAPIFNSLTIIFSFLQMHTNIKLFTNTLLHDAFHFFRYWTFVDVFIIGIIVTYIKLVGMASDTSFDYGFYVLLFYVFCFYMSNVRFEGKNVLGE